jgi:di/tricarboxylate transporter
MTLVYSTKKVTRRDMAKAGVAITVPVALAICFFLLALNIFGWF